VTTILIILVRISLSMGIDDYAALYLRDIVPQLASYPG